MDYDSFTVDEILSRVEEYSYQHLVLTGGEPLLHQTKLVPLLSRLKSKGFFVEVETNGTIAPAPETVELVDCFNVSPKTSNSDVPAGIRHRPDALKALIGTTKAWFKFVVCAPADLIEIGKMISELGIPHDRVILMPEGTDSTELAARGKWVTEACIANGYRFSPRLQILLFGDRRGT